VKIGRSVRYEVSDILDFMEKRKIKIEDAAVGCK
jgi:predicted DNA-binding transcriptional regulator AlpA